MNILHIGHGFFPWLRDDSTLYIRDLLKAQQKAGLKVSYLFSGRRPLNPRASTLRTWKSDGVYMLELRRYRRRCSRWPGHLYQRDKTIEKEFRDLLRTYRPDIIHMHSLEYLPLSLVDIVKRESDIPLIMSLYDYYPLCPIKTLFDSSNSICRGIQQGHKCIGCFKQTSKRRKTVSTIKRKANELCSALPLFAFRPAFSLLSAMRSHLLIFRDTIARSKAAQIVHRRHIWIQQLEAVDILIHYSGQSKETYDHYIDSLRSISLSAAPARAREIRQSPTRDITYPIRFTMYSNHFFPESGFQLLHEAVAFLIAKGMQNYFTVDITGPSEFLPDKKLYPGNMRFIPVKGPLEISEALNAADVGIDPTVWSASFDMNTFLYLAKGLPVITTPMAFITQYLTTDQSDWITGASSSKELAVAMARFIAFPETILKHHRHAERIYSSVLESASSHYDDILSLYESLAGTKTLVEHYSSRMHKRNK